MGWAKAFYILVLVLLFMHGVVNIHIHTPVFLNGLFLFAFSLLSRSVFFVLFLVLVLVLVLVP